jgi:hypothetical protein
MISGPDDISTSFIIKIQNHGMGVGDIAHYPVGHGEITTVAKASI